MPPSSPLTVEQIRKAARLLSRLRPAYAAMLAFYADVFVAQETAKGEIALEPIQLSSATLQTRRREQSALVAPSDLRIDAAAGERLLIRLCDLIVAHGTKIQAAAQTVREAVTTNRQNPSTLFTAVLHRQDAAIHAAADEIGVNGQALAFLAYNAIQPSLALGAEQLATYLDHQAVWSKGFCPVCGSRPALAILGLEGRRELHCRYCRHAWRAPRLCCAFCENSQSKTLHYFFAENEKDLRVDVCERCQRYLKSVDRREAARPLIPALEQIASLHLDIIATDKGYAADPDLNLAT
jgi:FdhE protein